MYQPLARALFLNLRENNSNYNVLVCCSNFSLRAILKILEKRPVILLNWFAAQQKTSTFRRQKCFFYSKVIAQSNELSSSLPKQQELV